MKVAAVFAAIGAIAAALAAPGPRESAPAATGHVVTMGHEHFGRNVVTIHVGDRLTFSNASSWLHVLVPGTRSRTQSQPGLPSFGPRKAHLSEHGDSWITDPWSTPGTYFITCQLHPEMTLEVRVLPVGSTTG